MNHMDCMVDFFTSCNMNPCYPRFYFKSRKFYFSRILVKLTIFLTPSDKWHSPKIEPGCPLEVSSVSTPSVPESLHLRRHRSAANREHDGAEAPWSPRRRPDATASAVGGQGSVRSRSLEAMLTLASQLSACLPELPKTRRLVIDCKSIWAARSCWQQTKRWDFESFI